jgi:hypothetical protein
MQFWGRPAGSSNAGNARWRISPAVELELVATKMLNRISGFLRPIARCIAIVTALTTRSITAP